MEKIDFNKKMEAIIAGFSSGERPKLLLQICCGPCSTEVLHRLYEVFEIHAFFYNPNIHPEEEYHLRFHELQKVLEIYGDIPIVPVSYETRAYFDAVKGLEDLGEHSARCEHCIEERMRKTAKCAQGSYDYFTTTLSISPYKNAEFINRIGRKLEEETGVRYLYADFKKKDGYKHSIERSKALGLYRQDYCGCIFSRREREEQLGDEKTHHT